MPIDMKDPYGGGQETIDLGRSTLPVRETYSNPAGGAGAKYADAMRNAEQITGALASLSSTFKQQAEKQQHQVDKEAIINADLVSGGNAMAANGGPGGTMSRAYPGAGSPDGAGWNPFAVGPSADAQLTINSRRGSEDFRKAISENPEIIELNKMDALKTNPAEYNRRVSEIVNKQLASLGGNGQDSANMRGYLGGAHTAAKNFASAQSSDAFSSAIQQGKELNEREGRQRVKEWQSEGRGPTQQAMVRALQDEGVDPAKGFQFVAIENPGWKNDAVSSNGSVGITQINDARWQHIKDRMQAAGQGQLAASLNDRRDPYQNARAFAWEYKRMEKEASAVVGRPATTGEIYMFWQFGDDNLARRILSNPDARVRDVVPANAIAQNPKVYPDPNATVAQMTGNVNGIMNRDSETHRSYAPVTHQERQLITSETWRDNLSQMGYKWSDFRNSGVYGGEGQVDIRSISAIDQLSQFMGRKIGINSAHRSEAYNYKVTGTNTGNHPSGDALDINITDPTEQLKAAKFLSSIGARGIELTKGHVHFDFATARPNQTEPVRVFTSRDNPVSGDLLNQAKQAVEEGRANMGTGNYQRVAGFQGKPADPSELMIRRLGTEYGIPATKAREIVVQTTLNGALDKAYNGDVGGAHRELQNFRATFAALSNEEAVKLNQATESIHNMGTAQYNRDQQRKAMDADNALDGYIKRIHEQAKAEPDKPAPPPRREEFPMTQQGEARYKSAQEMGLNIISPPASVSNGNLVQATSDLSGDPQKLVKDLGIDKPWTQVTPEELKRKMVPTGKYTPDDINKFTELYEKKRTSLPESQGYAKNAADQIYDVAITSMVQSAPMGVAVAKANSIRYGNNVDQLSTSQEMAHYKAAAKQFFVNNYAAQMEAARHAPGNNGQPLSGVERQQLADSALQMTQMYVSNMSEQVVAQKGSFQKAAQPVATLTNPQPQAQGILVEPVRKQLAAQGLELANVRIPNVAMPQGAQVVMKDGKPVVVDGAIRMISANGQEMFLKPEYNVLTQGAPQPTQAPAELQAPAAPAQAPAAQKPLDPRLQQTRDQLNQYGQLFKGLQIEGAVPKFLKWLEEQSKANPPTNGAPSLSPQ
jgi:hypothetical protein